MGSKKKPMFPINLPDTEGILIFKILCKIFLFGRKSFLSSLTCFGKKRENVKILTISVTIFKRIKDKTPR